MIGERSGIAEQGCKLFLPLWGREQPFGPAPEADVPSSADRAARKRTQRTSGQGGKLPKQAVPFCLKSGGGIVGWFGPFKSPKRAWIVEVEHPNGNLLYYAFVADPAKAEDLVRRLAKIPPERDVTIRQSADPVQLKKAMRMRPGSIKGPF